jgi:MoxR-like ATPase
MQFTPDTSPDEVTGKMVRNRLAEEVFAPGAAFTNVLVADEINRTPPRTQAALLEAMQERHVTVVIVQIVRNTREADRVTMGASPRAAIHLLNAAKAHARLSGREAPTREDVVVMAPFVLPHRIIAVGATPSDVVAAAVAAAR